MKAIEQLKSLLPHKNGVGTLFYTPISTYTVSYSPNRGLHSPFAAARSEDSPVFQFFVRQVPHHLPEGTAPH